MAGGPGLGWVVMQWSSSPTLPDLVFIPEDGKGACKNIFYSIVLSLQESEK